MIYNKINTLLSVKNINLSFGDKKILSDINFDIKELIVDNTKTGQIFSIVGKSGAGKSQLIRLLSGLHINADKSDRGIVQLAKSIFGIHSDKPSISGDISIHHDHKQGEHKLYPVNAGDMGIVFQDYYLPEHLKVNKILYKAAIKNIIYKKDDKLINEAIDGYLSEFELTEHKDKYPIQLSGGQKQRVSIIMQFLNGSNFILFDEPFSGQDIINIDKTTKLLQKIVTLDEVKTLIIVSHDLENCCSISDSVFVLSKKDRPENTGSTIIREIDLLERDLAYHPDIKRMQKFHDTIDEIKSLL